MMNQANTALITNTHAIAPNTDMTATTTASLFLASLSMETAPFMCARVILVEVLGVAVK
jgi:hypothetical protein